jgi:hypothetical protein
MNKRFAFTFLAFAALLVSSLVLPKTGEANSTRNLADQCGAVIVGVQCIGSVISGTGNSNEGGGNIRSRFLVAKTA